MAQDPSAFKQMAKEWLEQANNDGHMCARTHNNLVFCEMGIRIKEFVGFYKATSFSDAISKALNWAPKDQNSPAEEMKQGRSTINPLMPTEKVARAVISPEKRPQELTQEEVLKRTPQYPPQFFEKR